MKILLPLVTVILLSPLAARAECTGRGLLGVLDVNPVACAEEPARAPAAVEEPKAASGKMETAGDIAGLNDDPIVR